MFVSRPKLEIYRLGKAQFKFRRSNNEEIEKFQIAIGIERVNNNDNLFADYWRNKDDYYAAFLLKDFSDVEDENGRPCRIAEFDLEERAGIIKGIKRTDSAFSPWFKAHCEPPEKKITEVAASGELVDAGTVPAVQGQ